MMKEVEMGWGLIFVGAGGVKCEGITPSGRSLEELTGSGWTGLGAEKGNLDSLNVTSLEIKSVPSASRHLYPL